MGSFSLPHLLLFGIVLLVLFGGRGKISDIMGDVAKGIRSFKKGLSEDAELHTALPPEPFRNRDQELPIPQPQSLGQQGS